MRLHKLTFPASANWTAAKCVPQTIAAMMSLADVRLWGTTVEQVNHALVSAGAGHVENLGKIRQHCPQLEVGLDCCETERLIDKLLPHACLFANGAKSTDNEKRDYHTWNTSSRVVFDQCMRGFRRLGRVDLIVALSWPEYADGHCFGLILTNHGNLFKVYLVDVLDCKPVMGKFDWRPEGYDWARTVAIMEICSLFK
jgi:hypothetical protein